MRYILLFFGAFYLIAMIVIKDDVLSLPVVIEFISNIKNVLKIFICLALSFVFAIIVIGCIQKRHEIKNTKK